MTLASRASVVSALALVLIPVQALLVARPLPRSTSQYCIHMRSGRRRWRGMWELQQGSCREADLNLQGRACRLLNENGTREMRDMASTHKPRHTSQLGLKGDSETHTPCSAYNPQFLPLLPLLQFFTPQSFWITAFAFCHSFTALR